MALRTQGGNARARRTPSACELTCRTADDRPPQGVHVSPPGIVNGQRDYFHLSRERKGYLPPSQESGRSVSVGTFSHDCPCVVPRWRADTGTARATAGFVTKEHVWHHGDVGSGCSDAVRLPKPAVFLAWSPFLRRSLPSGSRALLLSEACSSFPATLFLPRR